jgi:enolase
MNLQKKLLRTRKRNDENAWMTAKNNEEVFEVLSEVAKRYNLRIGCDFAASTFFEKGYYNYKNKELIRDRVDQVDYIERLIRKYNLFYAEDPMNEDDFSGFKQINNSVGGKCMIVGDDLTTTNLAILKAGV